MITYQEAKYNFLNGNIADSEIFFMKNRCWLELAYCKMFRGSLDEAKLCFNRIAENNVRADWGLKLIPFLEGFVVHLSAGHRARAQKIERVATLRKRLKEAVSTEQFENAAQLRDQIRSLEAEL